METNSIKTGQEKKRGPRPGYVLLNMSPRLAPAWHQKAGPKEFFAVRECFAIEIQFVPTIGRIQSISNPMSVQTGHPLRINLLTDILVTGCVAHDFNATLRPFSDGWGKCDKSRSLIEPADPLPGNEADNNRAEMW